MLKVEFKYPEHGWMPLLIRDGDQHITIDASYLPYRSLDDLVAALICIMKGRGDSCVSWCTEPIEYDMEFTLNNGLACLAVTEWSDGSRSEHGGKRVFHAQYSQADLVKPFWRALKALQNERRETEFQDAWESPFSTAQLAQLTELLDK